LFESLFGKSERIVHIIMFYYTKQILICNKYVVGTYRVISDDDRDGDGDNGDA
jgi:hypothetical protein